MSGWRAIGRSTVMFLATLLPLTVQAAPLDVEGGYVREMPPGQTVSAAFMTLAVLISFLVFFTATRKRTMVPGRWQSVAEILYEFNAGMVKDNVGK